jgi:hypothetical protein
MAVASPTLDALHAAADLGWAKCPYRGAILNQSAGQGGLMPIMARLTANYMSMSPGGAAWAWTFSFTASARNGSEFAAG